MQINRVGRDSTSSIILAKDELGCLFVVHLHLRAVVFALLRQRMRCAAVATLVCFLRALKAVGALGGFLPREISQSVIFSFGGLGLVVVERYEALLGSHLV